MSKIDMPSPRRERLDVVTDGVSTQYTYDGAGQLLLAGGRFWTYDGNGNRSTQTLIAGSSEHSGKGIPE